MKRWLPKSLFGRNVLLIIGIIAAGQLTMSLVFIVSVQKPRIDELAAIAAAQVHALGAALALVPPAMRDRYIAEFNRDSHLQFETHAAPRVPVVAPKSLQIRYFMRALARKMGNPADVVWQSGDGGSIWIRVSVGDDMRWLRLSGKYLRPPLSGWWLLAYLLCGLLAFIGAYLIQRRLNRPLRQLAAAAQEMGSGHFPRPLPEDMPVEIATVSRNFNAMVVNLAALDSDRAVMLAGISHDLGTPLTKLQLGLAMLEKSGDAELIAAMQRQIEEIDATIHQFVDFARLGSDESLAPVDLNARIAILADEFAAQGHVFDLQLGALPVLPLRPRSMQRLLANLMQNAVRYAGTGLAVGTAQREGMIEVCVLDRGPGIPPGQVERLKRPFTRADTARSGPTGTGLGLAIVEKVAQLHGGSVQLCQRDGGGLAVTVTLPLSTAQGC